MKRVLAILAAISCPVLAAVTVVSFAQQPQPATQGTLVVKQRIMQGPGGPPPPPGEDVFFMASELSFGGKTVTGAPYSAQSVSESVQTLSDGNRIVSKQTSQLYRDSDGRTRREQNIKLRGSANDSNDALQTIFINDPVSGTNYILDSKSHTARKTMAFKIENGVSTGGQRFEFKIEGTPGTRVAKAGAEPPPPGIPGAPLVAHTFNIQSDTVGGATYVFRTGDSSENVVKEQLGKQIVEGVEAEGSRTTITIPAGEIGNEKPIVIVSERWYSPELQMVVMSKHSDPRSGETTYRLTNISRLEPAKAMFEVPADYTMKTDGPGSPSIMTMPAKVRRPE
jgi:hypothetical protein